MSDQQLALLTALVRDVPVTAICVLFIFQVNRTFNAVLEALRPLIEAIASQCIGDHDAD